MNDKKIIDYRIVHDTVPDGLSGIVYEMITRGWEPFGGIAVGEGAKGNNFYVQAMVKYAN